MSADQLGALVHAHQAIVPGFGEVTHPLRRHKAGAVVLDPDRYSLIKDKPDADVGCLGVSRGVVQCFLHDAI